MFQIRILSLVLTCFSLSLLTSCTSSPPPHSSVQEGLKLGTVLPKSGNIISGLDLSKAAALAVEEVNACGGVNGKPVTLIQEDSQGEAVQGAIAITKLAEEDRVAGVVGARFSGVSNIVIDVAVRNRVMLISPSSTSPMFTNRAGRGDFRGFWARTVPSDIHQAKALASVARQRGIKTLATIAVSNNYGIGFERQLVNIFDKLGGRVLDDQNPIRYAAQGQNFDQETTAILAKNAQAIVGIFSTEEGKLILQSSNGQNFGKKAQLLLTDAVYSQKFIKQVGKNEEGDWILAGALGTVPGSKLEESDITAKWQEKLGTADVSTYFPHTWDATVLLMLAAQASQTNTGTGIKGQIRQVSNAPGVEVRDPCQALKLLREGKEINYQGVSGAVDMDEYGDVISPYRVWQVKEDGTLAVIDQVEPLQPELDIR
ncbi:ABC transporter substrate-binding protein [Crocosphaera sp.]|uniref:ABC transporter substrate-binding protein n=1 Tax=Crocosphaera sp. TaxID=2729996 RepID=UPI00261F0526|nr:ABC transporter substrate-binding protein [Crocosphaera sp.]MDJ0579733.1 ABC transporter substrate-binding protein [Crocosphaera sp.]